MGYARFKKIDKNRYTKLYPFVRRTPRWGYLSNANFQMEIGEIEFSGEAYLSIAFENEFPKPPEKPPVITAVSLDPQQPVNVTVYNVSSTGADIGVSNTYFGKVSWHAIWIEE